VAVTQAPNDPSKPIYVDEFWRDGRGPELHRVVWNASGTLIRGIEYLNLDWGPDLQAGLRHVLFGGAQVVQITPEEVIGLHQLGSRYQDRRRASMFGLGRRSWLQSFAHRHLARCHHIQLLFYDQLD
jgi:hypothetical protein